MSIIDLSLIDKDHAEGNLFDDSKQAKVEEKDKAAFKTKCVNTVLSVLAKEVKKKQYKDMSPAEIANALNAPTSFFVDTIVTNPETFEQTTVPVEYPDKPLIAKLFEGVPYAPNMVTAEHIQEALN